MSDVAIAAPAPAPVAAPPAAVPAAASEAKLDAPAAAAKAAARAPDGKFQKADAPKGEVPKADTKTDAEPPKSARHKITVDGQDEEIELEELIRRAQKSTAADKRFREVDEEKKSVAEQRTRIAKILQSFDEDPLQFAEEIRKFGKDPRKFAEAVLSKELEAQIAAEEETKLSPEQKRLKELERELEQYKKVEVQKKADAEKAEADKKVAEHTARVEQDANEMGAQVLAALKATSLPQTPETAYELVSLLEETMQRGIPVKPEHLARELESRKLAEINALLEKADEAGIMKLLPKTVQERLQRATVQAYKKDDPLLNAKPLSAKSEEKKAAEAPKRRGSLNAQFARLGFEMQNGSGQSGRK